MKNSKNPKPTGGSAPGTSSCKNAYQLNQREVKFSFDLTLGDFFLIPDNNKKIIPG